MKTILLALPTTHQTMKSATAMTLARVVKMLGARGIDARMHNIDSAEIVTARDMFANMVLHTANLDGLLFIDSDMVFDPAVVERMLDQKTGVTAATYNRRSLDLQKLVSGTNRHGNFGKAMAEATSFTLKLDWEGKAKAPSNVKDGFCLAAAVGMGCALISKTALTEMVEAKVVQPRLDLKAKDDQLCWSFFGILTHNGIRLGEDYSFCYRWTQQMKRELPVCIDARMTHAGDFNYNARFIDLFA